MLGIIYSVCPKSGVVYMIRVPFKVEHIEMRREMAIELITELASNMSLMEEIYGGSERAFIYICNASPMDNSCTYDILYLFGACFLIGQLCGLLFMPFVRYFY